MAVGVVYGFSVLSEASFQIPELFKRVPALILTTLLVVTGLTIFSFGVLLDLVVGIKFKLDRFDKESWSRSHD